MAAATAEAKVDNNQLRVVVEETAAGGDDSDDGDGDDGDSNGDTTIKLKRDWKKQ